MGREITDLEARLNRLREAHGGGSAGASSAAAPARRGPGRPPGRKRGRPGRPPGKRGPGRPPGSGAASAASAGASAPQAAAGKGGAKRGRRRGGAAITPEQLASRQLQGRYLALVRQFPANKRANFAKVAKEKGREAAIREMQESIKK